MKNAILFLIFLFKANLFFAQNADYQRLVKEADALYEAKKFKESSEKFSAAFIANGNKAQSGDRYNAACSWALSGNADSSFFQLLRIAEKSQYAEYQHIKQDQDLKSLHSDSRWEILLGMVKKNYDVQNSFTDKPLRQLIDSLRNEDQKWRNIAVKIRNGEKIENYTQAYAWEKVREIDSICHPILKDIINQKGFPNYDMVGKTGSNNFWLLVQHQDKHLDFQEQVLSLMKPEVDKKKASERNYAYLIDRVRVNSKKLQIYGTQCRVNAEGSSYEPDPCEEPEKLNERRASVGLSPIEEYIGSMNKNHQGSLNKK